MPSGMPIFEIIFNTQYRLSRVHSAGIQLQNYNRIICYNPDFATAPSPYFLEGFNCNDFIIESYKTSWSFRKQNLTPVMKFDFDKFKVIGSEIWEPEIRSRLSITPGPAGITINNEQDVFSVEIQDICASAGIPMEAYNSVELGTNNNIEFYDRDVQSVGRQRNILAERAEITSTPAPEKMTEQILETL